MRCVHLQRITLDLQQLCYCVAEGGRSDAALPALDDEPLTLPVHFFRSRENAGQVSERCAGVMLMRCVRSALVPCA